MGTINLALLPAARQPAKDMGKSWARHCSKRFDVDDGTPLQLLEYTVNICSDTGALAGTRSGGHE